MHTTDFHPLPKNLHLAITWNHQVQWILRRHHLVTHQKTWLAQLQTSWRAEIVQALWLMIMANLVANSPDVQLISFTRIDEPALIQTQETFDCLDIALYVNIPGQYPLGSSDACQKLYMPHFTICGVLLHHFQMVNICFRSMDNATNPEHSPDFDFTFLHSKGFCQC